MAINERVLVFWICTYTCLHTEGAEYYISTITNTSNNVPRDCQFAQPDYVHNYDTGQTSLRNSITINGTQQRDVWIGYVKALTEFEYHGCADIVGQYFGNVTSLVDCYYACDGTYFGLYLANTVLKCSCMNQLPDTLTRKECERRGDFVSGVSNRRAIYSLVTDKPSGQKNLTIIANLCKASAYNYNDSAWIKCEDENNVKPVWCRYVKSSETFLTGSTFAAWNAANKYCADLGLLPSTAEGHTDMAFTNIFRNWTFERRNGSIIDGPMMFAYVSSDVKEIKFSANATESKRFLCLGLTPTRFYISTITNTSNNVPRDCQLAQPDYKHNYDTGQTSLNNSITINGTLPRDVWIGYGKALTEFEYHGCSYINGKDLGNVNSLVDCYYACNGTYFGLYFSFDKLKCNCIKQLPDSLTAKSCYTCGDFVCGKGNSRAIYSLENDKTSTTQNLLTIANLCMASAINSNDSAWIKCKDENNEKRVWCRYGTSRFPFLSGDTFDAWNEANDECANLREGGSLPSTAVGYNVDDFNNMAFTNIFRNWTLQKGNGSISGGPMMFAYVSTNSMEIKFTDNTTESKSYLCLGPKPTSPPSTPVTTSPDTATSVSTMDGQSAASKQQASKRGSTTTAVAAGVSVTVALAVAVLVIVLVLRNRKKLCFENTKSSNLENRDDDNHVSLQALGSPVINHTYSEQPNFGNRNGVTTNEVHPYFVLEKEGDQPVHNIHPNEENPYFVLEKQNTGNPTPIHTSNTLHLENTDGDTYQEIDTDDSYADIDDSREDNNDYDYTNKAFKDSRTEISDNVYNHLNAAGNEYDHLGKGQNNDEAMENNYDVTSSAIRK